MKIRRKHLIYLGLAIFPNMLLLLTLIFYKELVDDIGEGRFTNLGFFIQLIGAIIMVLGGSFMLKTFRKRSSFYFWLFATTLASIPVIYYFIV